MNIEIFPAEKSCEQGCFICPLAAKGSVVTARRIDPKVQATFFLIENMFKRHNLKYDMHHSSRFDLFPELRHPELIRMARFSNFKHTDTNSVPEAFSESIYQLLKDCSIKPGTIGFSIVPQLPIVSAFDAEAIDTLLGIIGGWYFKKGRRKLEVTIRTNLIKGKQFNEMKSHFFAADNDFLVPIMKKRCSTFVANEKPTLTREDYYWNLYRGKNDTRQIVIANRVIGHEKNPDTRAVYRKQSIQLYPHKRWDVDFAIAPKGVMINHSSVAINNPILWLSHDDFRGSLERESNKPHFNLLQFAQTLIVQNDAMYGWMWKNLEREDITPKNIAAFFEKFRPDLRDIGYAAHQK